MKGKTGGSTVMQYSPGKIAAMQAARERQEARWASLAGPVETRVLSPEELAERGIRRPGKAALRRRERIRRAILEKQAAQGRAKAYYRGSRPLLKRDRDHAGEDGALSESRIPVCPLCGDSLEGRRNPRTGKWDCLQDGIADPVYMPRENTART